MPWLVGVCLLAITVGIGGTVIRLPYNTLSPGAALDVAPLVSVKGAKTYSRSGDVMLLFVRERDHVNVWSWLQAKLDSNIDMFKPQQQDGGIPEKHPDAQGVCDMAQSKVGARVAALTELGYKVKLAPHVDVVGFPRGENKAKQPIAFPAENVLYPCDEVIAVDGHDVTRATDVSKLIAKHAPGSSVTLDVIRDGKPVTAAVPVVEYQGKRIIGISAAPRFVIPVSIKVDTGGITGPSAGLAMALAIIDDLTPGDLTGGKRVAVTGTIAPDGSIGEIGGLPQKAVAAKAAHAQIFIVPKCVDDPGCDRDLATAKQRVGEHVDVEAVATLAEALRVLRRAGGAPVVTSTTGARPAG
jgi:PDZ domain-containing protein